MLMQGKFEQISEGEKGHLNSCLAMAKALRRAEEGIAANEGHPGGGHRVQLRSQCVHHAALCAPCGMIMDSGHTAVHCQSVHCVPHWLLVCLAYC
jgi:hypothetical protein